MNFVAFSPYFPPNYVAFSKHLHQVGITVLGLGDVAFDDLAPELREALTEYYRVSDLHQYDELVRALGYFTHKYGKLDRIESHNEYWLETDARLREDFNIPGLRPFQLNDMKNKSGMKEVFRMNGIPVARGAVCKDLSAGIALAAETGYPMVAKPDRGVGANQTYKLGSQEELVHFFSVKPDVDYILEEFIKGDLYTFDGLVDRHGQIVFRSAMLFNAGVMEMVNEGLDMWYYTLREIPPELEQYGTKLVQAYQLKERFFHFEFFLTPKGYVVLEVNMRPPGGMSTDMWNFANDIDIYEEYASVVASNTFNAIATRPYHCAFIGRRNGRTYQTSHDDLLLELEDSLVLHEPISGIFAPALGDYGYLVRSPDLDEVRWMIERVSAKD